MLKSEILEHSINEKLGLYEDGHYNMSKSKEKHFLNCFYFRNKIDTILYMTDIIKDVYYHAYGTMSDVSNTWFCSSD